MAEVNSDTIVVAATWNAGGGEAPGPTDAEAADVLTKIFQPDEKFADYKATIFMGQEFQEDHDRLFLQELGLEMHRYGRECVVAWDPTVWTKLSTHDVRLNPKHPFYRPGSKKPVYCDSPAVILGNKLGLTIDALSLHLPSSRQKKDAPKNRVEATTESIRTLAERNANSFTHARDYAGDDNVDETGPWGPWNFMLEGATGLKLLQAPSNTLGRRKVDDHRVAGLVDGGGVVIKGPTDHNAHIRRMHFWVP